MNIEHLRAFLWLRWRLRVNQFHRAGTLNAVLLVLFAVAAVIVAVLGFVGAFLLGFFALGDVSPQVLMYIWDGILAAFLFAWMIGLAAELQRSESLSLERFLHLPVSLSGAFLINYLSSLFSFNLLVFVPAMLGLALGLLFSRGPTLLLLLPLLAAMLLMVTALTYQFQGWLASLMVNKRRRRTIIVVVTMCIVLICQAPQLINVFQPWNAGRHKEIAERMNRRTNELNQELFAKRITPQEHQRRHEEIIKKFKEESEEANRRVLRLAERIVPIANLVVPPGWLALGAAGLAEGDVLPAVLATLALGLMGSASLWRAYRTTVRLYTGQLGSGQSAAAKKPAPPAAPVKVDPASVGLLERRLPWVSEQASAIAMAGLRSTLRAPEAKMMLLTPIILVVVFGAILLTNLANPPPAVRPVFAFSSIAMVLFSTVQLVGNQFGFDRSGFRVFVLCPAPRRDVLLGKNLAFAPVALGMGLALIVLLQFIYPMRVDHFLASLVQAVSMYLLFCLLANVLSILAPVPMAPGAMKMTSIKGTTLLMHLTFMFLFPLALAPTLLPLGLEVLVAELGGVRWLPIYLLLSLLICAAVVALYRVVLDLEGRLLAAREQKILEVVASKAE